MDLQIKTFRIHSAEDERALNAFLAGKIVRHWATSFSHPAAAGITGAIHEALSSVAGEEGSALPSRGAWDVFIAYEIRMSEARPSQRQEREAPALQRRGQDTRPNARPLERNPERPAREKLPREEYQPQIPEKDLPLYEAVRKWRNARAKDERVKPFELFNNRTLEELVKSKPSNATDLKALVPEMEPRLWERYNNELLGFMETAVTTNGHSEAPVSAVPQEAPIEQ
jgi:superfamily II DNA helicase RecQ